MVDFSLLRGIGQIVHEQNQKRDEFDRQQVLQQDQDKRHAIDAGIQHFQQTGDDPNALPEVRDYAHRAALDTIGKIATGGYKAVNPKEFDKHITAMGQIAMGVRKKELQKTLGVKQQQADQVAGAGDEQNQLGDATSSVSPFLSMLHSTIGHSLKSIASDNQPAPLPDDSQISSSTSYTPDEVTQRHLATKRSEIEMQKELQPKFIGVPAGGSVLNEATGQLTHGQAKFNKDEYNLHQAYDMKAQQLGTTAEAVEANPQLAATARQEWADKVAPSIYRASGKWVNNPDPFSTTPFVFQPTPYERIQGGQSRGAVAGGGVSVHGTPSPATATALGQGGQVSAGGQDGQGGVGTTTAPTAPTDQTLGPTGPTGPEYLSTLPPNEQSIIKMIGEYRLPPASLSGMGGSSRGKMKLMGDVGRVYPDFDTAQYNARYKFLQDLKGGSGQNALALKSLNMTLHHIGTLVEKFDELHNRSLPMWNSLANKVTGGMGGATPGNFKIAANTVATELSRLMRGSGVMSEKEIQDWKNDLDVNMSPEQFKGRIDTLFSLIAGRTASIDESWKMTMGKPRDYSVLWPSTKKVLKGTLGRSEYDIDPAADRPDYTNLSQSTVPDSRNPQGPQPQTKSTLPAQRPSAGSPAATKPPSSQFSVGQRARTADGHMIVIKALSPDGTQVTDYDVVDH